MAARQAKERVERLEAAIIEFVPQWSLGHVAEVIAAPCGALISSPRSYSWRRLGICPASAIPVS
jgi:hypothetical protein